MKCISLFFLSTAVTLAADFATGQAARVFIGQVQATRQDYGATATLLGGLSGVAYANDTLFIADSNRVSSSPLNNRVLVYPNWSSQLPKPTDELSYTQRCPSCVGQASVVLGQPDFNTTNPSLARNGLRTPTSVASDGRILAVADTDNNRILIWNTIPTSNAQPADVVVGQPDFTTGKTAIPPTAKSMRGPQGVWVQNGKLYVADTQDHRILIYNRIPTQNGAAADIVLGQPDFTAYVEPDLTQQKLDAKATNMLNPVSVNSDGVHLFVSDLGYNRVLVWNSIPTTNQQPADIVIGQPDMNSSLANTYSTTTDAKGNIVQNSALCPSNGTDANGNATYPQTCNATLNFPRYALGDGHRLFIADGGNDRVLVFNTIPTANAASADYVIGQLGGGINQASDAADSMRTPVSLAWDGTNLYVGDTFNRRVNVYSVGEHKIPYSGVRNSASMAIYAVGGVTIALNSGANIQANDKIVITIGNGDSTANKDYTYTVTKDDSPSSIIGQFVDLINAGPDPNVFASPDYLTQEILLVARAEGTDGNNVTLATKVTPTSTATITATASGANLTGGGDAASVAPGTVVTLLGDGLSDGTASAPAGATELPTTLSDTQVYFDGVRAPLLFVSPTQINAQIPWEFLDTTSISAWVRTRHADGTVSVTTPVATTIVPQNPGIYTQPGNNPRPSLAVHYSSYATGTVSVDGTPSAGDLATVTIEDRSYKYIAVDGDTLDTVRDHLIDLINQDPKVMAFPSGVFDRIRLRARVAGPAGNGIAFSASSPSGQGTILTPTNVALCCANIAGAPVTADNPAVPGETIVVYATGLGLTAPPDPNILQTGIAFAGGVTQPAESVSSLAGGKTANVLYAGLKEGSQGVWEVHLELNSDLPSNTVMQLTIAQSIYVSNIVTVPLVDPRAPAATTP